MTDNEFIALTAILNAGEATTGSREEGWWSHEILMYGRVEISARTFAAVCGTLAKKGFVYSTVYSASEHHIGPTPAGLAAFDEHAKAVSK